MIVAPDGQGLAAPHVHLNVPREHLGASPRVFVQLRFAHGPIEAVAAYRRLTGGLPAACLSLLLAASFAVRGFMHSSD